jgi:hypothetical protein
LWNQRSQWRHRRWLSLSGSYGFLQGQTKITS